MAQSLNDFAESVGLRKCRTNSGMTIPEDAVYAQSLSKLKELFELTKGQAEKSLKKNGND